MLASGRTSWNAGDRIRVYRTRSGSGGVIEDSEDRAIQCEDLRDYDVDHYARLLRVTFAVRLARALAPEDFEAIFADPHQMSLFSPAVEGIRTLLVKERGVTGSP
jgi:hypothetical protein